MENVPRKILQENPAKLIQQKSPSQTRHISAEGPFQDMQPCEQNANNGGNMFLFQFLQSELQHWAKRGAFPKPIPVQNNMFGWVGFLQSCYVPNNNPTQSKMEMLTRYGDADRDADSIWRVDILCFWEFGEGVDSARGVAAIVLSCRNSSCNSSCDAIVRSGQQTIPLFLLLRVQ